MPKQSPWRDTCPLNGLDSNSSTGTNLEQFNQKITKSCVINTNHSVSNTCQTPPCIFGCNRYLCSNCIAVRRRSSDPRWVPPLSSFPNSLRLGRFVATNSPRFTWCNTWPIQMRTKHCSACMLKPKHLFCLQSQPRHSTKKLAL
jgi:hypothetical protein